MPDETTPAPTAAITLPMIQRGWFGRYGPDHPQAGQPIERQAQCACGRTFTQSQLGARFLSLMDQKGLIPRFAAQMPDFYAPANCGACERQQLTLQAQIDESRVRSVATGTASQTYPDRRVSA